MREVPDRPIAEGRTAEVFAWGEGYVLKLFREWWPPEWAENEAEVARSIHASGLPVPAVGDTMTVNGRLGIVYERVAGVSMLRTMTRRPWHLLGLARTMAQLHAAMHERSLPQLDSLAERMERRIVRAEVLSGEVKERLLTRLHNMPAGDRICHGDFHPDNIILTRRGPVVIDWDAVTRGNPLADVARTSLMLSIGKPAPGTPMPWMIEVIRRSFHRAYLRRYFGLRPGKRAELAAWRPLVAAMRLTEGIAGEQEGLLAIVTDSH